MMSAHLARFSSKARKVGSFVSLYFAQNLYAERSKAVAVASAVGSTLQPPVRVFCVATLDHVVPLLDALHEVVLGGPRLFDQLRAVLDVSSDADRQRHEVAELLLDVSDAVASVRVH